MRGVLLITLSLVGCGTTSSGLEIPKGYERVYGQDFATKGGRNELDVSDPKAWAWHMDADARSTWIEASSPSEYQPPFRSPHTIALIRDLEVGDFVFELEILNTAPASRGAHRDLCLFFGWQDPANFYYVHLAPGPDDHAHNVFLVDDAARRRIADVAAQGIDWGDGWHKVRLERSLEDGSVRVFFDDMETPVLVAADRTHGWGRLGFGTFDDSGRYTNIQVFAPEFGWVDHQNPFE
jgi:hypothetical protein